MCICTVNSPENTIYHLIRDNIYMQIIARIGRMCWGEMEVFRLQWWKKNNNPDLNSFLQLYCFHLPSELFTCTLARHPVPAAKFSHSNQLTALKNLQKHLALSYAFNVFVCGRWKRQGQGSAAPLPPPAAFWIRGSVHCELYWFLLLKPLHCACRKDWPLSTYADARISCAGRKGCTDRRRGERRTKWERWPILTATRLCPFLKSKCFIYMSPDMDGNMINCSTKLRQRTVQLLQLLSLTNLTFWKYICSMETRQF